MSRGDGMFLGLLALSTAWLEVANHHEQAGFFVGALVIAWVVSVAKN